jgi:hypothetical protein
MLHTSSFQRLIVLGCAFAAVAACDTRSPLTPPETGTGTGTGTGGTTGTDAQRPVVTIDTPTVGTMVNVGDSLFVAVRVRDNRDIGSVTISAYSVRGDPDLGTATVVQRYTQVVIPGTGAPIPPTTRDTVFRRYLQLTTPADTTQDVLYIRAIAVDRSGNADTTIRTVQLVAGPRIAILSPSAGDSISAGIGLAVTMRVTHRDGIASAGFRAAGDANWPTRLDTTFTVTFSSPPTETEITRVVSIPTNAPARGRITITPFATDVNRLPGSGSAISVFIRGAPSTTGPRVTHSVSSRAEINDSVTINASGDGIRSIGFIVRDSTGATIRADSITFPAPYVSPQRVVMALALPRTVQGMRLTVISFATDASGRIGYSVPSNTSAPVTGLGQAHADSVLIVHGRTFQLPRQGIAGDVAVDRARGHVFVSNTAYNRLEVWSAAATGFDAQGVAVGSQPWGLAVSVDPNILLVANSGGTNISRVNINSSNPGAIQENLAARILTRNTYLFRVRETRDESTGKVKLLAEGPFSYSDRPQYLAQSAGGRIFYSTRPTTFAPEGTIRWLDPNLPVPDPRQIWQYGTATAEGTVYTILHVDSLAVIEAPANSTLPDTLVVWDHPYGAMTGVLEARASTIAEAVAQMRAMGSDIEAVHRLDIASLALTDTTFVATSGARNWIAFGEGNTRGGTGRVMMAHDTTGLPFPDFFSPVVTTRDIMENAAEPVFGLALDRQGRIAAIHGQQSYFASIENPFHLRLQGKFDSFDAGAGIAFHPNTDGILTPEAERLAFVASANGTIELVDAAYYVQRGRLNVRGKLYGPLRASLPFPGDPPEVVLKLFGLTEQGLVVIDLTAQDIRPRP